MDDYKCVNKCIESYLFCDLEMDCEVLHDQYNAPIIEIYKTLCYFSKRHSNFFFIRFDKLIIRFKLLAFRWNADNKFKIICKVYRYVNKDSYLRAVYNFDTLNKLLNAKCVD